MSDRDLGFGFGGSRPKRAKKGDFVASWKFVVRVDDLNPSTDYWMYVIVARTGTEKMARDIAKMLNHQRATGKRAKARK